MIALLKIKQLISLVSISLFPLLSTLSAKAQIVSSTVQQLSFGTFCPGTGGTITVSPTGVRIVAGDVIVLNLNGVLYTPAIIEVDAPTGSRIAIIDSNTQLKGSNGGSMTLHINGSDPVSPFITTASRTNISIGGTLTVGGQITNPPGKYSGLFYITFMME